MRRILIPLIAVILLVVPLAAICIFFFRPHHGPTRSDLTGRVVSDSGPIEGAVVRFQGNPEHSFTNANGDFTLPRSRSTARVTASKDGHFIAGTSADTQPMQIRLRKLPDPDNEAYSWVDPTPHAEQAHNCGNCHAQIYDEWKGSGHARSANNRRFRNLYEGRDWYGRADVGWSEVAFSAASTAPT